MNTWVGFWGFAKTKWESLGVLRGIYHHLRHIFPSISYVDFLDHLSKYPFIFLQILVRGSIFLLRPFYFHLLSYVSENLISFASAIFLTLPYVPFGVIGVYTSPNALSIAYRWFPLFGFPIRRPLFKQMQKITKLYSGRYVSAQLLVMLYMCVYACSHCPAQCCQNRFVSGMHQLIVPQTSPMRLQVAPETTEDSIVWLYFNENPWLALIFRFVCL